MQKPWQEIVVMLHSEINCVFQEGDHSFKGKRFLPQDTIKFGCPARQVPYHVTKNMTSVAIFCVCRMPNDKKEYVQCSQCNGWFHPTCVSIPAWVLNSNRRWKCDTCKGKKGERYHLH